MAAQKLFGRLTFRCGSYFKRRGLRTAHDAQAHREAKPGDAELARLL